MKQLHRSDLFGWSEFNLEKNIDFHSILWVRDKGNIVIDPLPLSEHDDAHLELLGGVSIIIVTNSDHTRDAVNVASRTGAKIYGPAGEQHDFPISCDHWVSDQEEIVPGLLAFELEGSKTPGELALLLDNKTLITGDLIRCHMAGRLCLLPDAKLSDKELAHQSVRRLGSLTEVETVLTGDGWPVFSHAGAALKSLLQGLN